ncbi:group 1 truncated hemoglobin [Halorussus gelatinilyticus]|uniref:Group 1 truncated hemoglobin n=1 Tax=Halorussus gelatinilyticus TaxID=2937524 RepID=A0A8U0IJP4_9EURY|nr:group 1 truncated hemoglobin [Halorussus gelatinilyticus]UPW00512.1 group 1 truncated hemoglobin [Halorussus gelatinilyticus]
MSSGNTLYHRLGGEEQISSIVDEFYQRVLSDESVAHFFDDVDMAAQRAHQTQFLSAVAGGPVEYDGEEMREAHAGLGLESKHFRAIATHLDATLREFDVSDGARDEIMSEVAALEDDVLVR